MVKFKTQLIAIAEMLIFSFLFAGIVFGEEVAIDYSSKPIQTIIANQNWLRNGSK